ncbi:MAG TPA: glycosyltransferase family 2 protein [Bacteroidales bacterium]|nr:glycosyltransferase family 2 protein [Bacteroidales bacterium]
MLSIIIPYHNEPIGFIRAAINQVRETIDVSPYEIIIVDDGSVNPLLLQGENIIRHEINKGVGAAFDTGAQAARYDNLFLMGSDIRFQKNGWASKMIGEIQADPKAFICTRTIGLSSARPEFLDMEQQKERFKNYNGATILVIHSHETNPRMPEWFKSIIEAKWLPDQGPGKGTFEVPCILGAAYGVSRAWYMHCDGFAGHRKWGTLEPYISLKSWLFGGSCKCASGIETGHIFKPHGTHGTSQEEIIYNKMLVATLLFDNYKELIGYLGDTAPVAFAEVAYKNNLKWILAKREEYKDKTVIAMEDLLAKLDIKYPVMNEHKN